jgi:peptide/nickel transport system ATP-binding protein
MSALTRVAETVDPQPSGTPLLALDAVSMRFPIRSFGSFGKAVHAMEDVGFVIHRGESLALVGESGSGKTTTANVIARIHTHTSGSIRLDGSEVGGFTSRVETLAYRKKVQMIFQDPFGSLNPTHTIRQILERPFVIHGLAKGRAQLEERICEALDQVGLSPARGYLDRFPHELSGGQRQRVSIARSFSVGPQLVLADEPTSMLDVSVRMGIMNMMLDLREKASVSYLYITHDLAGARYMCPRVAVMYAGMIMEIGPTDEVIGRGLHPYVQLLRRASPEPLRALRAGSARTSDPRVAAGSEGEAGSQNGGARMPAPIEARGEIPSLIDLPSGCRFHPRCAYAMPRCKESVPSLHEAEKGHLVRCFLHGD